ncbi:SDR family oxidoreductase [Herbaspirillum sp. SJZ099]|uniref:SDR family oxidoreductase n=1 Tax=Herbaspirillum sp. SJZ099 TaxID=2572916 RepID=UPI0011A0EA5A|nr:SDR family oxidoreductase [Herbaspirillum sp. SJZ099]TWC67473.1 NAD(P)-dependent dehydrogenase (short-subunit alcohol dehydrogenase family) [Herbaspirillum sp. SJZ099]
MDLNLKDKKVIVTAGAQGIGLAITAAFVEAGAQVHICDVSDAFLDDARQQFKNAPVSYSRTDVTDEKQVDAMFAELSGKWNGRLDVLVNNAGIAGPTLPVEDVDLPAWDQTIAVNLTGPFLCARRAVPMLKNNGGGSIVNISSVAGRLGFALRTPYSASKYGVIGLTESWAIELGPDNIRVNAVLPGVVAGARQERVIAAKAEAFGIDHEEMRARVLSKVSMRKMVTAEDIANQIIFICSPAGASISGRSLSVCGNVETLG